MNELKYQITQLIFLVLLGIGGYWALTHLDNGMSYSRNNVVDPDRNQIAQNQDTPLFNDIPVIGNEEAEPTVDEDPADETPDTGTDTSSSKDLSAAETELVNALNRLIGDDIYMKVGSRGTRVGSVQKFLAYYFPDKKVSADNEYGPGTKTLVEQFQKAEGLSPDGQAGPNTYKKMIEVIKK